MVLVLKYRIMILMLAPILSSFFSYSETFQTYLYKKLLPNFLRYPFGGLYVKSKINLCVNTIDILSTGATAATIFELNLVHRDKSGELAIFVDALECKYMKRILLFVDQSDNQPYVTKTYR